MSTLLTPSPTPLKAPALSAVGAAAKDNFVTKPKVVKMARKALTLADSELDYVKIALYSQTGCGKTLTCAHLLEAGLKVVFLSTDFGGAGTSSIIQFMKDRGTSDLLKNCYFFSLETYDDVEEFVFNPKAFWPEIYSAGIDVLFFDGVSSLQTCLISDKVMSLEAQGSATPLRNAGLFASTQDWGGIRNASIKIVDKFLRMRDEENNKPWHKIMTFLESDKAKDNGGETKIGPMLSGAAAKLMEPCFDLIIRLRKKKVTEGTEKKIQFSYECEGSSDRIITKSRGFKLNTTEPGDFGLFWRKVCDQRGLVAERK